MRARREGLGRSFVLERSQVIESRLLESDPFRSAKVIALYSPFRGEVETDILYQESQRLKKKAVYPRIQGSELAFFPVDPHHPLQPGRFGILEPQSNEEVRGDQIDILIVPGVAFDERGFRLGFGQGYYDRFLKSYSGGKVGLAYDFQILPQLPVNKNDIPCDQVVTEFRIVRRSL